jgi:hypothetical protein
MDSSQLRQKHAEERPEQAFAADTGVVHKLEGLNMDSSQLCQKHAEERHEQPFAPDAGVVHELEEPKVQR